LALAETRLVLGTAGHIDHGKTTLIHALTGVDTDRLPEEQERGITIDLGFAPLDLADGRRISVVDVPGHEGLVRTMVSGATGIDLALIVVAADEGVMPQTREHVAICRLLGISRGVVALTKIDIADPDVAELAADEASSLLESMGFVDTPVVPVSAVTGEGIEALRETLGEVADSAEPRTPRSGPARLNVDRCFAAKGFGCVVTGTLVGAPFAVGDAVEIFPSGRRARVRGVQHHGLASKQGEPGMRCALNLQGVEVADVSRGQVIATPDSLIPTHTVDVMLTWLEDALEFDDRASVEFLVGTAERRAHLAAIGTPGLRAGSTLLARVHLEGEPLTLLPGDHFIARGFSRTDTGGSTFGGGIVLDVSPPHRRRSDPLLESELRDLSKRDPALDLTTRIHRAGLSGISADRLRRETGLVREALAATLERLADEGSVAATVNGNHLGAAACKELESRLLEALDAYHAREPLRPGMPTGALRGQLPENVPRDAAELALMRLQERGDIALAEDIAHRTSHRPTLSADDRALVERIQRESAAFALEPPSEKDWSEQLGTSREHLQDLLAHLKRAGKMVRTPGDLWFDADAIAALQSRIEAHFESHDRLETPDYKALIGTTRRTAVPLMEYFDEIHLTLRNGPARILRRK